MYRDIMLEIAASKVSPVDMISYYGQMCIPANKDHPDHASLVDAVVSDELVVAIKAKLAEQDLIKL